MEVFTEDLEILAKNSCECADVPIVGPGKGERLLEARVRLEEKRMKSAKDAKRTRTSQKESARHYKLYDERESARENYYKALREFGDRYFPKNSYYGFGSLDEEEKEVLDIILLEKSKRHVLINFFALPATLWAIIYATGAFSGWLFWMIIPWFLYFCATMFSVYGRKHPNFGADYHLKFLRAKLKLSGISKKEKREEEKRESLTSNR